MERSGMEEPPGSISVEHIERQHKLTGANMSTKEPRKRRKTKETRKRRETGGIHELQTKEINIRSIIFESSRNRCIALEKECMGLEKECMVLEEIRAADVEFKKQLLQKLMTDCQNVLTVAKQRLTVENSDMEKESNQLKQAIQEREECEEREEREEREVREVRDERDKREGNRLYLRF